MRIIESLGEDLGLAQTYQHTTKVARWNERRAQGEPEIDGLLARGACLWQMREGIERLLEIPYCNVTFILSCCCDSVRFAPEPN